ncbi:2-dehydropantoate 2-reductase [Halteromyces radiatus]|uniref:2-dehydropantoate 2-reductase n=1 Tax=Halteromyces radiatus TaxID=101107 RepID=UPI00222105C9|nr:2-dehydropantoate 2-reductase [Halteromyces radiatus]KAI8086064.1 2-dehydropantoate 2-reductase [Halteromyces radiatus]
MQWNVLGTGAIGCLLASQLRLQKLNVNLLLRSQQHLKDFQARKNTITYECQGKTTEIDGFTASVLGDKNIPLIENLVVATKAHHTAEALGSVVGHLKSDSSVLLLQNGMGIVEELESKYWSQQQHPRLFIGVNRHAAERLAPFHIIHHSGWNDPEGGLMMGEYGKQTEPSPLAQTLQDIPIMQAITLSWQDLYSRMLKKLVVNATINPVASILNIKNGGLVDDNPHAIRLMHRVCEEVIAILGDDMPGETAASLIDMVITSCRVAAGNTCSMLQDIKAGRKTEINYINGYLCRLAKTRGIDCPTNMDLVDLILAKEKFYQ